jgi:hypothetical protein
MSTLISARLHDLMANRVETVEDVTMALGWTPAKVQRILDGKAAPEDYEVYRLARHFNRAPSWLYYGEKSIPLSQRSRFENLDNLWVSATENESTEEAEKEAFSQLLEGAGKRRVTKSITRKDIDDALRLMLEDSQNPFSHYYED